MKEFAEEIISIHGQKGEKNENHIEFVMLEVEARSHFLKRNHVNW